MFVNGGQPVNFNYTTFDAQSGLNVAAVIYDVTNGTPALLSGPTAMTDKGNGTYVGSFTPVLGKYYLVIAACYTTSGFTTPDTTRAPSPFNFEAAASNTAVLNFNYGAFDQYASYTITATIYNITDNTSANVTMVYVTLGVYFGQYTGAVNKSYFVYQVPSPSASPNSESFQCFAIAGTSTDPGIANVASGVSYEINNVPLVGTLQAVTNNIQGATLSGQSLKATLVG